jgi:hypothetical protein
MSFECINESDRIHYVGTQLYRVIKVPTGGRQLGPPQAPLAATQGGWETDAASPSSGSEVILPKTCRKTGTLK